MKSYRLVPILFLASAIAQAASNDGAPASQTLPAFPKNLARQHLGANLLAYSPSNQTYAPTEAAAAWLDDDVSTGWPAATGRQYYLVVLAEPQLVNNFCVSARSSTGTVSLYAGDEPAPPTAKSWHVLAQDVPVDSINEKLSKPFGRFAKYLLIETNLTDAGPWYSIYLYGEKPATAYQIQRRAQPVDPRSIFGPYVNTETNFSLSSLYAHSRVTYASSDNNGAALQKAIDDNPETGITVSPSETEAGLVIRYDKSFAIRRISVLTDGNAKGKLQFFLTENNTSKAQPEAAALSENDKAEYIKVVNNVGDAPSDAAAPAGSVSVANKAPIATIDFDGTSARGSADFASIPGTVLSARWIPENAGQILAVREVNSFSDTSLSDSELAPDRVGEDLQTDRSKDGKNMLPAGIGEGPNPEPVGDILSPKTPFIPGGPIFPPPMSP